MPWQHSAKDYKVSSLRFSTKQSISYLEETNPTHLETHERGAVTRELKEETFLDEPTREHVPGIEFSNLNMAFDIKVKSFGQLNHCRLHT